MESPLLGAVNGLVADSSILVTAERTGLTIKDVIQRLKELVGDVPIVACALTVAERGHGIYHASSGAKARYRRKFLDELKQHVPIHPITAVTAEIIARIAGEQAIKGVTVPLADLIIGACAMELDYSVITHNLRHFKLIPGLDLRQF